MRYKLITPPSAFYVSLFFILLMVLTCTVNADEGELRVTPQLSTDGVFNLSWDSTDQADAEIQQSTNSAFTSPKLLYQGRDTSSVLTGLANGNYYFRIRTHSVEGTTGEWSDAIVVRVKHHSMSRAWLVFSLGAFVFVSIVLLIFFGNRKHREMP